MYRRFSFRIGGPLTDKFNENKTQLKVFALIRKQPPESKRYW